MGRQKATFGAPLAVGALLALVVAGCGSNDATKAVGKVATIPVEVAQQAAAANVRAAVPSFEAFYAEHGTYAGATIAGLRQDYDSSIDSSVELGWVRGGSYCLQSTVDGQTASIVRPDGDVVSGGC